MTLRLLLLPLSSLVVVMSETTVLYAANGHWVDLYTTIYADEMSLNGANPPVPFKVLLLLEAWKVLYCESICLAATSGRLR